VRSKFIDGNARANAPARARSALPFWRNQEGQSLIELAIIAPLFTLLICAALDCGYFFLVDLSLNSAARNSTEYAVQGTSSPAQAAQPSAAVVSNLALGGIGLGIASSSTVSIRVCSRVVGVTMPANIAQCTTTLTGAGAVSGTPDIDPESPVFQLSRVDVLITVRPLIPLVIFPTQTFHRMVEMRSMQ
jgi:Flp pilus assembly protein TadG